MTIIQLPKFSITQSPNHRITQLLNNSIAQSPGHPVARSITQSARIHGFTLIELLVVLVIMGLFVGLVSTIVRPDDRALLRVETERLAQLLDLAATESRLTGKSIAWTADALGYRFWRFSEDTAWSEIRDVDSLRPRTFPQGMKIASLRVENRSSPEHMRLEFTSYGPTLSFVIDLSLGAASYSVEGSPIGEVRILPDERKANGETAPR
jgi:general secretion pathway protein H